MYESCLCIFLLCPYCPVQQLLMANPLTLTCTLASAVIPLTGQPRLVYLLLETGGGEGAQSLPINLGLVIDVSDSMKIRLVTDDQFTQLARSGRAQEVMTDGVPAYQLSAIPPEMVNQFPRRIDYVSEALLIVGEYLRPSDYFSLVAFAGKATTLIPVTSGKEGSLLRRLTQAARQLEYLNLGDGTLMAEGLALAFDEINRQPGQASRLVLLTDGHTLNVKECYAWAKRAREAGLPLTTVGVGSDFNEDLLIPLADTTGGNAYFIEKPDQIPEAFRKELGTALGVSYRNVEIKLQLPTSVELRRVHRVLPELGTFDQGPNLNGSYALLLGNYDPAVPVALLLELIIPAWQAGSYRLSQVVFAWDDPWNRDHSLEGMTRPYQRQDVVITLGEPRTPGANSETLELGTTPFTLNQRVMNIIERVGAFKQGVQALESAQSGDKGIATVRLRQSATRLLDMGELTLANAMLHQAETLERGEAMDPNTTKKLRYETRRLNQGVSE